MITIELINANELLKGLTDDQKKAVVETSKNDEATVMQQRISSVQGVYDSVIKTAGIEKNEGESTEAYLKRAISGLKANSDTSGLAKQIETLTAEKTELQNKLNNSDPGEIAKQRIADLANQLGAVKTELKNKIKEIEASKTEYEGKVLELNFANEFNTATKGLKFKEAIPESVRPTLLNSVKAEIMAKGKPAIYENELTHEKSLVFRDAAGNIITNKGNNLNPYSVADFVKESTVLKDVLDEGKKQSGAGSGAPPVTPPAGASGKLDLSGCKTQVDADEAINHYLGEIGITAGSPDFYTQFDALRTEGGVADLPMR